MFPNRDLNPKRRFPVLTYGLIAINLVIFIWEMSLSPEQLERVFLDLAVVPVNIAGSRWSVESLLDIIRSMFLHSGYEQVMVNMAYLWLFGSNVEDRLGKLLFLALYLASGIVAIFVLAVIIPFSNFPYVGTGGSIAGVLGGYLLLFPGIRVRGIVPLGRVSWLAQRPAYLLLWLWFIFQIFNGVASLGVDTVSSDVTFLTYSGGFLFGLALTGIVMELFPQPPVRQRNQMLYQRSRLYRY